MEPVACSEDFTDWFASFHIIQGIDTFSRKEEASDLGSRSISGRITSAQNVSESVRLLGASFFQDMTRHRKGAKTKVYSATTLLTEETEDTTYKSSGRGDRRIGD